MKKYINKTVSNTYPARAVHYAVAVTTHTSLWTLVTTAEEAATTGTSEGVAGYPTSYIAVALIVIIVAVIASYLVLRRRK